MPIETIEHLGNVYPAFQASGNAMRFVLNFAKEVCKGNGVDVGCNRLEWCFPGAFPVDPAINEWDAYNFPLLKVMKGGKAVSSSIMRNGEISIAYENVEYEEQEWDYICSSHCLEHLPNWASALDYWHSRLKVGGVVFMYLPDHSQSYWRVHSNRKHIHAFTPEIIKSYFTDQPNMWKNVFVSQVDLNNSFVAMAERV